MREATLALLVAMFLAGGFLACESFVVPSISWDDGERSVEVGGGGEGVIPCVRVIEADGVLYCIPAR